jgi:integrase
VIIPSTLVKALASWVDRKPISAEGALITDWNGKRISTSQIRRRLYLIGQAAGVDVKPHDLRHTYVYSLLDAMLAQGKNMPVALDAARKQARHGDVKTTMLYLRSRDSQIRAAVEAM